MLMYFSLSNDLYEYSPLSVTIPRIKLAQSVMLLTRGSIRISAGPPSIQSSFRGFVSPCRQILGVP
jgi:hypothetical protein